MRSTRIAGCVAGLVGLCWSVAPAAVASPAAGRLQRVIVLMRTSNAPAGSVADLVRRRPELWAGQNGAVRVVTGSGGRLTRRFTLLDGFAATVPPAAVARLRQRGDVAAVLPDRLRAAPRTPTLRAPTVRTSAAPQPAPRVPGGPQRLPSSTRDTCPANPAKPQLEPQALSIMRAASDDPARSSAADYATGAGVRVGVIGDAVDVANPDLRRADGSPVVVDYRDFAGTGTSAAADAFESMGDVSSIAAQGRTVYDLSALGTVPAGCTIRVRGVAPGADVVAIKAFDNEQSFYDSTIVGSIDFAVSAAHVDVLNESLTADPYPDTGNDPISLANAAAVAAGVTVVTGSGDAGRDSTIGPPASAIVGSSGTLTVGASTQLRIEKQLGYYKASRAVYSGDIATLSSTGVAQTGRTIDVVAPGYWGWSLCSADPTRFLGCPVLADSLRGLSTFAGTSESAPLTAGVAALVIDRYRRTHRGASPAPQLVKQIITSTADDISAPADEQGAGEVDALRAVRLAGTVHDGPAAGSDVLVSPTQRTFTVAQGTATVVPIRLTNPGRAAQSLTVARRRVQASDSWRLPVDISSTGFTELPFTVPRGTDRIAVSLVWPGSAASGVSVDLVDPRGDVANEAQSQGPANNLTVEADRVRPGAWTMQIFSYGYSGSATALVRSYRDVSVPLARVTLAARRSAIVVAPMPAGTGSGERVYAVTVADTATARVLTSVPVVVRTLVDVGSRPGRFSGTLGGGDGRAVALATTDTYLVDVPPGAAALRVALHLDRGGQEVDGFLTSPAGSAVDRQTTLPLGSADATAAGAELDLDAVDPQPGRWTIAFGVNGAIDGARARIGYTGAVRLTPAAVTATGLPASRRTFLPVGVARHVTVHLTNRSSVPHAYVLDPRRSGYTDAALGDPSQVTITAAQNSPSVEVNVPPETTKLTDQVTASAQIGSVFAVRDITPYGFSNDPELYESSHSGRLTLTAVAPQLPDGPWVQQPVALGPFRPNGIPAPITVALQATAHTRTFDTSITSQTGDPWLGTVMPAGPVNPVTVPAHASVNIAVTITPTSNVGHTVRGTIFVDDWDPRLRISGELAALPYRYTVSR